MSSPLPNNFIRQSMRVLSTLEQEEIWDYFKSGIYYLGLSAPKSYMCPFHPQINDVTGYYVVYLRDHLYYRYEIRQWIGRGTFSDVVEAYDHKCNEFVIIRIASLNGKNNVKNEYYQLLKLHTHDLEDGNFLLKIKNQYSFRGHFCVVQEKLYNSLKQELEIYNREFSPEEIRRIASSAFSGLNCIHSLRLVHANIKASNILLVDRNSIDVKIIDYSYCHPETEIGYEDSTEIVARYCHTREYCAPEIILQLSYGKEIDVWGMGCIVAELILGTPLFQGLDDADQLASIIEVIGMPPWDMVASSSIADMFFDEYGRSIYNSAGFTRFPGISRGPPGSRKLSDIFRCYENIDDLIYLIEQCLQWNPNERLTTKESIRHLVKLSALTKLGIGVFGLYSVLVIIRIIYGLM